MYNLLFFFYFRWQSVGFRESFKWRQIQPRNLYDQWLNSGFNVERKRTQCIRISKTLCQAWLHKCAIPVYWRVQLLWRNLSQETVLNSLSIHLALCCIFNRLKKPVCCTIFLNGHLIGHFTWGLFLEVCNIQMLI